MSTAAYMAQWRAARPGYIAKIRADKKAAGICRQCPDPVAIRSDGTPYVACRKHLDADAKRVRDRRAARKVNRL